MQIISIPTENFRSQNPLFHTFYEAMRKIGVNAADFSVGRLVSRDLALLHVHFPEHFATNFAPPQAILKSAGFLGALAVCKLRGAPIVWSVHNVEPFDRRNMWLYHIVMTTVRSMASGYIFLSQSSRAQFEARFPGTRIPVAERIPLPPLGMDRQATLASGPPVIGMLGEQKDYKDPVASLRLFEAARRHLDCRLLIAGTVYEADNFRTRLAQIPREVVQWDDRRLSDDELEAATQRAHFALLPYTKITNSAAAMYALCRARPIITTSLPLFREYRDFFGPAWVRIADGAEASGEFWAPPTQADLDQLRMRIGEIDMPAAALRHKAFFERLLAARRGRTKPVAA